jgi:hypothetical protein
MCKAEKEMQRIATLQSLRRPEPRLQLRSNATEEELFY